MEYFSLIVRLALAFTFIFAGLAKLIDLQGSAKFAEQTGIFPKNVGKVMGGIMPFMELFIGILLCIGISNLALNIVAVFIIIFFLILNMKTLFEKKNIRCFCFGHIISTRLGAGGLYHYLLLFIFLLITIFFNNMTLYKLILNCSLIEIILIILSAIYLFFTGLLLRMALDVFE